MLRIQPITVQTAIRPVKKNVKMVLPNEIEPQKPVDESTVKESAKGKLSYCGNIEAFCTPLLSF